MLAVFMQKDYRQTAKGKRDKKRGPAENVYLKSETILLNAQTRQSRHLAIFLLPVFYWAKVQQVICLRAGRKTGKECRQIAIVRAVGSNLGRLQILKNLAIEMRRCLNPLQTFRIRLAAKNRIEADVSKAHDK